MRPRNVIIAKFIVVLASLFVVSGCATLYNPATGKEEFILISSATERAIGENAAKEMDKKYPLSEDRLLQERIAVIGRRVAAVSDRKDIEYKFYALANEELNALTLPGGLIYVNKGLTDILNDDELASVIAHEVGHVSARHIAKKLQANMAYQVLLGIAFATSGKNAGNTGSTVAQGIDTVYNLIELKYSRNDEYEADRLGIKYSQRAGFDPHASIASLEKLKKGEGPNWKVMRYFRTHPYVDERIKALTQILPK